MRQSGRKLSFQRVGRQEAEPRASISEAQIQALRPDSIHAEHLGTYAWTPVRPLPPQDISDPAWMLVG